MLLLPSSLAVYSLTETQAVILFLVLSKQETYAAAYLSSHDLKCIDARYKAALDDLLARDLLIKIANYSTGQRPNAYRSPVPMRDLKEWPLSPSTKLKLAKLDKARLKRAKAYHSTSQTRRLKAANHAASQAIETVKQQLAPIVINQSKAKAVAVSVNKQAEGPISKIANRSCDVSISSNVNRVSTSISQLPKTVRLQALTSNGYAMSEADIVSSHIAIICSLSENQACTIWAQKNDLYKLLAEELGTDRGTAKAMVTKALYAPYPPKDKLAKALTKVAPEFAQTLTQSRKQYTPRGLSRVVMNIESAIIADTAAKLYSDRADMGVYTVFDAVGAPTPDIDTAAQYMTELAEDAGVYIRTKITKSTGVTKP